MGSELGQFLRARRSMVAPADRGRRRRVPGLRREEVAAAAGVSTDYYTRLEQGRHRSPSASVLRALAGALELDEAASRHLLDVAQVSAAPRRGAQEPPEQTVRPSLLSLLASFTEHPAFVRGRRTEVLAMNPLAAELLTDIPTRPEGQRSLIHWAFADPEARRRYVDWDAVASSMVGTLRLDAGRHPGDLRLQRLVEDLQRVSPEFRRWWEDHRVAERRDGLKRLENPRVGRLDICYEALEVTGERDQTLFVYHAEPDSATERRLRELVELLGTRGPSS